MSLMLRAAATARTSGPTDPYFANVVALLHMDGSNGGTTFTDVKGHTWTPTAVTTSTASKKFGTASAAFGGSATLTSTHADYVMGTGDMTFEFFMNLASITTTQVIAAPGNYGAGSGFELYVSGGVLYLYSGGAIADTSGFSTLAAGTWQHIALVRASSVPKLFVDGALQSAGVTWTNTLSDNIVSLALTGWALSGNIDELRITKGVARYSSNFTPATAAFPDA